MSDKPVITQRTVYHVRFRGKTKYFSDEKWIAGWVAKQVLVPLLDEFHRKFGEIEADMPIPGPQVYRSIFSDYYWYKKRIKDLIVEHGIPEAERMMREELSNGWE